MDEETKARIDGMTYIEMLRLWRFSPIGGNTLFQGETGKYFAKRMRELRDADPAGAVAASKQVGW